MKSTFWGQFDMIKYQYIVDNISSDSCTTRAHYHSCYELIYYFRGNGYNHFMPSKNPQQHKTLVYDTRIIPKKSQRFEVEPNRFIIYKPYTIHSETLTGASEVFAIVFIAPEEWEIGTCLSSDIDGRIAKIVEKIRREYQNKKFGYNTAINALLTQLIIHIKRQTLDNQKENPSIQQAINFLDDYYTTEIDLHHLAHSIGYSLDHFRFLFKESTGIAPKKYILQKRLALAKKQISHSELPLTEIAENCGYDDYYQFATYFKKEVGISPSQYRKNKKQPQTKK